MATGGWITRPCSNCGQPFSYARGVTRVACPHCQVENLITEPPRPDLPPGSIESKRHDQKILLGLGALVVVAVLAAVLSGSGNGGAADPPAADNTDESTCEIARDIGGSFNVTDTFARSQERVADLYRGYGQAASPAVAAALRDWSAGMTSGDLALAAQGVSAMNAACTAEGF